MSQTPDLFGGAETTPSTTHAVSVASVLRTLGRDRLLSLARDMGATVTDRTSRAIIARDIERSRLVDLGTVLGALLRDELRKALAAHGLDTSGRARRDLAARLLEHASPEDRRAASAADAADRPYDPNAPHAGALAVVRQRQYVITDVVPPPPLDRATPTRPAERVRLVCLDDDAPGRELEVFWPLELGARVIQPGAEGLGTIRHLDRPAAFGAYLDTLRWNAVSATDNALFQSPFRAGIKLLNHQIPPLSKALALPRANLFIADDVGLGKTIEAGLVMQELILRQQVERVLIVAPAAITLQWRDEMERRFGQRFEIMNRAFVARRRRERGFGVNPWTTHSRFIVSYQTLRRPEYLEGLRAHLDVEEMRRRSLLVLDEAHTVAPASGTRYSVDSRATHTIRDLATRFDNRLFLSATPHNGHSSSFSALLEILDPARFTRGVPITDPADLAPVMIRRLKKDLRALGEPYPERQIVRVALRHADTADTGARHTWTATWSTASSDVPNPAPTPPPETHTLSGATDVELRLSRLLAQYTRLARPARGTRARLVFVSLQKRLLSSVAAFDRTLIAHTRWLDKNPYDESQAYLGDQPSSSATDPDADADPETHGISDEAEEAAADESVASDSKALGSPVAEALAILQTMRELAARHRDDPSPKVLALRDWIERHCLVPAPTAASHARRDWTDRRLIVFTEYATTKRYLSAYLREVIADTTHADERILQIHGGMSDETRAEVQQRFNDRSDPARILLATDAAREGVNLHGACADLFHFDIPWNPARLEQRNGRIDRTGQASPTVRCHYFTYPERAEDRVLDVLVAKVEVIRSELGSLGDILLTRIERTLADGIDAHSPDAAASTAESLAHIDEGDADARATAQRELESVRAAAALKKEIDDATRALQRSAERVGVDPVALRAAIDVGCQLAGAGPLVPEPVTTRDGKTLDAYRVPHAALTGWERTLDTLRPPRPRGTDFWEWRDTPPLPVVFEPPPHMGDPVVHLHLEHPFCQRALSRFRSQGYGQHDLSRATIVRARGLHEPRAVAFARLSLFGEGARRLHDEVIAVAAPWREAGGDDHLVAVDDKTLALTLERLDEALIASVHDPERFPAAHAERLARRAADDFAALWPALDAEADARAEAARVALATRGRKDADALRDILTRQKTAIATRVDQLTLDLDNDTFEKTEERRQVERDRDHMVARSRQLDAEVVDEPAAIEALFAVTLARVVPVGLVYLWPETR